MTNYEDCAALTKTCETGKPSKSCNGNLISKKDAANIAPCKDGVKISSLPKLDFPEYGGWIPITHDNTTMRISASRVSYIIRNYIHDKLIESGCCSADGGCCGVNKLNEMIKINRIWDAQRALG